MDKKRRDFLKIAGVSTLAGLGGTTVVDRLVSGTSPVQSRASKKVDSGHGGGHEVAAQGHAAVEEVTKSGNRFGMIVDLRKFKENPALGDKVVAACHATHNVPDFPEKKDVIKWTWLTGYGNAFTEHSNLYKD